ncbi:thioredoxin family protein [Fulvivirgaceae bacterium PWU4]|uniref:Thioredoxin family protein n=1 Tax=Chryseosolibacter histidini TaxID=2782349 RepID=A0AAP2GM97_9BACT|nr:cytochrome c biogenesis protein CcdA [Chryseosolibacter histidini]MBT1701286.1 thioredoxin family protein [Chryseosolibacter histidini]
MKFIAPKLLLILLLSSFFAHAQVLQPAKWTTAVSKQNVSAGDEIELIFKATIDNNWYMYANDFDPDCGPLLTELQFEASKNFELVGKTIAIKPTLKHDKIFDCDVKVFLKNGEFRQKIKVLGGPLKISGSIQGQVCTEVDGKCIPFDEDFSFDIAVTGKAKEQKAAGKTNDEEASAKPAVENESVAKNVEPEKTEAAVAADNTPKATKQYGENQGPVLDPALVKQDARNNSFLSFFLVAILAGLAALLTPCVFPMIPMTVSFFTQGKTKFHAIIYGISIVAIYTVVGAAIAPLMGPETANHLSTEWLPNLIFFLVFIVFGLSFLGLFEIVLPGTFITKMDRKAEKGGLTGVFFMAFTLVLVSFSCTGPLVGSILVSSAGGEFLKPIVGMFGFSLAFAIPFTLFAFFPNWLNSLPKSGGWLNSVKVVLGFVEIALAFKFLSIADQAFHWGILDREINIAIWIVITVLIGLYLMKAFRLPGDTGKDAEDKRVSIPRLSLAIITFTFVVYLIPGLWGAPLKALAGYLPPMYTHDFDLLSMLRDEKTNEICDEPKYADFLHLPHGLKGYFDYDQALACARQQNKPLFIDFTGHGCTNCREMEANVWSAPEVLERLRNDFVVVALYVDDKTELPESEWYTSTYDNKVKKTIGKQNADLQIRRLNNNAQPFYILVGEDEKVLVPPQDYDKSVENFIKFLESGKKTYSQLYLN